MISKIYIRRGCSLLLASALTLGIAPIAEAQLPNLPKHLFSSVNKRQMQAWTDSVYQSLSPEERLGQLIMPIIYPSASPSRIAEVEQAMQQGLWGGILYQKGQMSEQLQMNQRLQQTSRVPLLIALDGEWGLYMRLKDAPRYPRNMGLGFYGDTQLVYDYGREVARQCRLMGIHVNFAPTVDVNINPQNPVIGTRSFGEDPKVVGKLSTAYAMGLEDGGVLSVAKHFPGHGDTSEDSHHTLPLLSANKKRMNEVELAPFRSYIQGGFGGIMTAHLRVPAYEPDALPSSLSYKITTQLLQEELGFRGLVFTDGLEMKGAQASGRDIGVLALLAGNDVLLGPRNPLQMLRNLIDARREGLLSDELIRDKCKKILAYKYALIIAPKDRPASLQDIKARLWSKDAQAMVERLWRASLYFSSDPLGLKQGIDPKRYKRIAVVQMGKNPIQFTPRLDRLPQGVSVDFVNYGKGLQLEKYDLVVANMFSTDSGSLQSIRSVSGNTPLLLVYYSSPYRLPRELGRGQTKESVVVAFEGAKEAQTAVLGLIGSVQADSPNPATIQADPTAEEQDPTAKMTASAVGKSSFTTPIVGLQDLGKLKQIDQLAEASIRRGVFPGCQIVAYHRGKLIYNKAFGTLTGTVDNRPVTEQTIYDVASVTKAFATTPALMLLVGEGKVSLHAPLSTYLPWLKDSDLGQIRIKELLLHESGLRPSIHFAGDLWDKETESLNPTYISTTRDSVYSLPFARGLFISPRFKELMKDRLATSAVSKAKRYSYSDLNFILLQQVIEAVSGKDLASFVEKRIYSKIGAKLYFNPLEQGIPVSRIAPTEQDNKLRKQVVQGTVHDEAAACLGGISGNAGLFGSAIELAKVGELLRNRGRWNGKQIIAAEVVDQFTKTSGKGNRRFLGFDKSLDTSNSPTAVSASSATYGHLGFTGTCVWVDPVNELTFVFLSNRTYPSRGNNALSRERIRPELHQLVYDALGIR